MKKIITLLAISVLSACSSSHVNEDNEQDFAQIDTGKNTNTVAEAPIPESERETVKKAAAIEEPVAPPVPAAPSQYAALSEAIKSQNEERIYKAATQILAQSGGDAKALNALAMYHYKKSRFELSRYLLNKAISGNPKMAELHSNLGVVQLAQNEKREAIKSFRKALDINNEEGVAAANLGAIYVQERDYGKALIVLETAYRRGVRDARVLNNYAIALIASHKYDKAQDLYQGIIKENSNNKEFLYNYAVLLIENMGKFEEGLEIINRLKFVGGPADTRNRIIALENKAKAGLK